MKAIMREQVESDMVQDTLEIITTMAAEDTEHSIIQKCQKLV